MDDHRNRSGWSHAPALRKALELTLAAAALWPAMTNAQQPTAVPPLVFDNVTVIDVQHGERLSAQRVVIVGNHISAMGNAKTVQLPKGARVVNAQGKYLIPGLWDMHTHSEHATDVFYPLMLANGVTGFRDAGSMIPLDTLRRWRKEIVAGTRVGPPRQILSGQSITNYPEQCDRSQLLDSPQTCVADSADAVHYVDSLKAAGADMIKPRDVYPPMYLIIAAESRRVGLPFGGHTWDNMAIMASDSGAGIIDHITPWPGDYHVLGGLRWRCWAGPWPGRERVSVDQCRPIAEKFTRNNTWVVPTLIVERFVGHKDGVYMTKRGKSVLKHLAKFAKEFKEDTLPRGNWLYDSTSVNASKALDPDSLGVLRIMQEAGLPIMAGTDAAGDDMELMPPGFTLHAELAMDVAEGLTPLTALQSATINPAKFWHATDSLGTVAPGKLADLVLLDADPLADITNITTVRAVVANGRYFDRTALDQLVTAAQAKAK